jgi:hypothetical protein
MQPCDNVTMSPLKYVALALGWAATAEVRWLTKMEPSRVLRETPAILSPIA